MNLLTRWRPRRSVKAAICTLAIAVPFILPAGPSAGAGTDLIVNPGLESLGSNGFPVCWEQSGYGTNDYSFSVTSQAHSGNNAMRVAITSTSGGDRKAMMGENQSCAPGVTPGHQYDLSAWYTSTTPDVVITAFRHDVSLGWQYWTDLMSLPVTSTYQQATVRTPQIPPNTDQITWGVTIYGVGTLTTDDYSMVDATQPANGDVCTAGAACTQGAWQVMPFQSPVRAIHAVLMRNGDVLMIAGSGNDPDAFAAGTFTSAVYDPRAGTFQQIPTPSDMFCSGHVQLPDGRILILGGNKAYPAADGSHGYEGLNSSYIFDPTTNTYQKVNNLNDGHWYPSATELGNGDVISFGGLRADSTGSVTTEYFSNSQQQWLPLNQVSQTWSFWGLYPAMILMQDGRLFYTGSHVFGSGLPGAGADIYDYNANTITSVAGLQDKDERDQSMSVLLPPAQSQRVLTAGGGNVDTNVDANRFTDIIDLSQPNPAYTPGPLLPTGTLTGGAPETSTQGKMYVSTVILPNAMVFETGGGLHDREDPVYEASMFNPQTDTFTPGMATDPVPRTYHSSAFLLPDARVMAVGNNPGDGSFDMRISVYSPPYMFDGARPQITSVASQEWSYGSTEQITVDSPVVSAELIRPAAVTHSSDSNQRYVDLPMTVNGNSVGLNVTSNPDIAPPGWYMLFVTNANGVPSVAQWVHLS
jgi:Domain of unknown function (DUF1929)/Glyoxal oxidase N-terminus